jgi:hypothetical protein
MTSDLYRGYSEILMPNRGFIDTERQRVVRLREKKSNDGNGPVDARSPCSLKRPANPLYTMQE